MSPDSCKWARKINCLYCINCPFPDCLELIGDYDTRERQAHYYIVENNKKNTCPSCGSLVLWKYGKRNGIQRYMCRECGTYFRNNGCDVHQHHPRLHKSIAIEMRQQGLVVREIIDRLKKVTGQEYSDRTVYGWILRQGMRMYKPHTRRHRVVQEKSIV